VIKNTYYPGAIETELLNNTIKTEAVEEFN